MNKPLWKALAVAGIISMSISTTAHAVTLEDLEKRLIAQDAEMQKLKTEIAALKAEQGKQAVMQASMVAASASKSAAGAVASTEESQTVVSSYGEIEYSRPTNHPQDAQVDVSRAVIAISHRFDAKTKMVSEFEWEHAVTSNTDKGESEVEQLYVDREFDNGLHAQGGLMLMPVGLLNTNHEPTAYFGVQRNFVETAIIPTTWREAGFAVTETTDNALTWNAGLTTGFDLSKWDATSTDGQQSPLASIHQEGQLAKAGNLSVFGAVNWQGVPGLLLGGFVFNGKAGQRTNGFLAPDANITLFDLHTRYQAGKWDLSALYAKGMISDTNDINASFAAKSTRIPASFYGSYAQAAYKLWSTQDYSLTPFLRYERFNAAKSYSESALATGAIVSPDEQVWTLGGNFMIGEGVVLKADYLKFKDDSTKNRMDLGVGYSF
jgi:hypothetical protein